MIEVSSWVVLNFFTSFLLILLLLFQNKTSRLQKGRRYSAILFCTFILIASESIGRIGEIYPDRFLYLAKVGYFIIFLLDPVDILCAVYYIDSWMDDDNVRRRHLFINAFALFASINFFAVLIAQIFDNRWFFYFEDGLYYRGPFFLHRAILLMIFIMLLLVYALVFRKDITSDYKNAVMALPIMSLLGALLQVVVNMDTTYAGISLGCLIVFFFFQSKDVNIDYLTGVLNRRGLDIKMADMVKSSVASGNNFYAIMMDIDYFKEINDNFGHEAGDRAIKVFADILVDTFGQNTTAIGRFGGDEFCVIIDNCPGSYIDEKIGEVRARLERAKKKYGWPRGVDISCGYKVFESDSKLNAQEFQSQIDDLMYMEKIQHHNM